TSGGACGSITVLSVGGRPPHRDLSTQSCPGCGLRVVGGSEAAVDVVVDHADVLHEGEHARRPDEAVSLRLQLLCERLRLRRRRGEVCDRPRRTLTRALVEPREAARLGDADLIARAFSTVAWILERLRMIEGPSTRRSTPSSVNAATCATSNP